MTPIEIDANSADRCVPHLSMMNDPYVKKRYAPDKTFNNGNTAA